MILFYLYIINFLVMFLAAAHSYLFLCLRLSTECLVSASEQVFNPDEWRGINALYNNNNNIFIYFILFIYFRR